MTNEELLREALETTRDRNKINQNLIWLNNICVKALKDTEDTGGEKCNKYKVHKCNCGMVFSTGTELVSHQETCTKDDEAINLAYENWCEPRMNNIEPDHPYDAWKAACKWMGDK